MQEQVPNHLWRLWSKAMVVSAEGKGLGEPGQVTGKKRNAIEPLMKCRKRRDDVKTAASRYCGINSGGACLRTEWHPAFRWPDLVKRRFSRTWEPGAPMQTEKLKWQNHESESTEVEHRGRTTHSSEEGLEKG